MLMLFIRSALRVILVSVLITWLFCSIIFFWGFRYREGLGFV